MTTPTTHILKTQIGTLPNGVDLSNSVENEYYGLKLVAAFGLPVNAAEIKFFGKTKAIVIERFDRKWTEDGRLLRVPQEDFCQDVSCPTSRKDQNEGAGHGRYSQSSERRRYARGRPESIFEITNFILADRCDRWSC